MRGLGETAAGPEAVARLADHDRPGRGAAVHFEGTKFTLNAWDGQNTGEELYGFEGYTEPAFKRVGGAVGTPEVSGLAWTCTYENPTDETDPFGPFTVRNEHCNLFGFYRPTLSGTAADVRRWYMTAARARRRPE